MQETEPAVANAGGESEMDDVAARFLKQLKDVCGEIAQGNYDRFDALSEITIDAEANATIAELAESFGSMVVQVEAREFHLGQMLGELQEANRQLEEARRKLHSENVILRDQVQRMKIEIDQSQKEREVSDIVGTDYFQTLQRRAREMRARHREPGEESAT
jgi:predicted ribosome quality control (RQC) complex YloA/Tae2 family protein